VTLRCPLCQGAVSTSELEVLPKTGGGFKCPRCGQLLRFYQPYRVLRTLVSCSLAASVLLLGGIRNIPALLGGTFLLSIPISLLVNAYSVHFIPLVLTPWKPPPATKTPMEVINDRNAPIDLFPKKRE
jgi:hypothetical protein